MTKFNFKLPFLGLDNQPVLDEKNKEVIISELLKNLLTSNSTDNFMKHVLWALSLEKDGFIEVDDVDRDYIKDLIKSNRSIVDLVKSLI